MKRETLVYCFLGLILGILFSSYSIAQEIVDEAKSDRKIEISGEIKPLGKPIELPKRIQAGKSCIIDIKQTYTVTGNLTGAMEIDYRIIVSGDCGLPPGTFDEEWIAFGTFTGMINGQSVKESFSYMAYVKAGGKVNGEIVFRQELNIELRITGNMNDGKLSYEGQQN